MNQLESPYKVGARRGLFFGPYLCLIFFATIYSQSIPFLGLIALLAIIAVPFVIYKALRSTFVAEGGMSTLSSLWMQGIMIFIGGSLVCAVASTVYMRWVNPSFLSSTIAQAIDFYASIPDDDRAAQVADLLNRMVEAHAIPSPIYVAIEMVWISIFSGSLLSLLMALLARARSAKPPKRNQSQSFN